MAKEVTTKDYTIGIGGGLRIGFRSEAESVHTGFPPAHERVDGKSFLGLAWTRTHPERVFKKTANWYLGVFRNDIIPR